MSEELAHRLDEACQALARGEVIGLPTETVYGVGVDPFIPGATDRLFAAKGRPADVALPVLVAEPAEARELAVLDARAEALVEAFWPGPLTIVLWRRQPSELRLGGDETTIGLRSPAQPVARELLSRYGPLAVTSANRHGELPCRTAAELDQALGEAISVVVDGGYCDGTPSTVLSLLGERPAVLRAGGLTLGQLTSVMGSA